MTPDNAEEYLHAHIPLSKAMGVSVVESSPEKVVLAAPLLPNINHRETLFGGSASAIAILAAWTRIHLCLSVFGGGYRLVIYRNEMTYERAVAGAFTVTSLARNDPDWARVHNMFVRHGKARITATATLDYEGETACRLTAEFVALRS